MRYLIKLLKAIPNIIRSIPAIMFVVSLTTADSENTGAAIAFILISGAILYIQLKVLDLRYKKAHRPERQRSKDYSKEFAELCLKFEIIPPPKGINNLDRHKVSAMLLTAIMNLKLKEL